MLKIVWFSFGSQQFLGGHELLGDSKTISCLVISSGEKTKAVFLFVGEFTQEKTDTK